MCRRVYDEVCGVLLNGINAPTDRGDAQDRTLPVELERIPDNKRRSEEDLWQVFEWEHGRLLGALFDTLAKTLRAKETLRLHRRPRLADWGEYAAAAYSVLGWGVEEFLQDWGEVVKVQNQVRSMARRSRKPSSRLWRAATSGRAWPVTYTPSSR